jgi:membrane fusion protein (multidrug efflux system)
LRKTQLSVEAAQAGLDLTKNADPARVKSAQLQVEQAQLNLAMRKRQIGWDLQTANEGLKSAENSRAKVVTPSDFDVRSLTEAANAAEAQAVAAEASAEAAATQAQASAGQAAAAKAQVAILESQKTGTQSQVAAARSQAEGARASAEQASSAYRLRANPYTEDDLKTARAGVAQAEAAVALARASLAETFILAPFDGTVTARNVSVGTLVNPGQGIVTVISTAVEITLPIEEARVGSVREGQTVTLTSPALPGTTLTGTVSAMTPSGDARNRSFTARVRPADTANALRPGMFVQAAIATSERADTVTIARDAIVATGGENRVYVLGADNKVQLRAVRLGIVSGSVVEVLDGVKAGEKVVVTATDDLRDGVVVNPSAR